MVMTVGMIKRTKQTITRSQQILPGIPDEITTSRILSKVPWLMLQKFALVSYAWLEALRNGKIFEARVSANSTQTLFIHCAPTREPDALQFSLYSVEDNSVYHLPTMPDLPSSSKLISFTYTSVKGRLYVIGRKSETTTRKLKRRSGYKSFIYEYNLIKLEGWRQCATPLYIVEPWDCAILNDKIIVYDLVHTKSGLYDPDADVWSPIISHIEIDGLQKVLTGAGIEGNLVYQHGFISESYIPIKWIRNFKIDKIIITEPNCRAPFFSFPSSVHATSAEQEVESGRGTAVPLIHGKFFKLTQRHIDVYDSHTNTWTPLHFEGPFEFVDYRCHIPGFSATCAVDVAVVRIKNEIYSVVEQWCPKATMGPGLQTFTLKHFLMKSKIQVQGDEWQEKSSSQQNVVLGPWKQLQCNLPLSKEILRCPIQL